MTAHISLSNLLCNWDISLLKVIKHLEEGRPDSALVRCKEMHKVLSRIKKTCETCDVRVVEDI